MMRTPLILILFLIATASGIVVIEQFAGAEEHTLFVDSGLATSNRSSLSICIDGAGEKVVASADVSNLQQLLERRINEERKRFETFPYPDKHAVSRGCPPSVIDMRRPFDPLSEVETAVKVWAPDAPSEHLAFVYLVSDAEYTAVFGNQPYVEVGAEYLCEEHVCAGVTTALYVPESVPDRAFGDGLMDALGLLPDKPQPELSPTDIQKLREEALGLE